MGRILGPRGMTTKQLEQETGCKIMVRGKGSMRDKKKVRRKNGLSKFQIVRSQIYILWNILSISIIIIIRFYYYSHLEFVSVLKLDLSSKRK